MDASSVAFSSGQSQYGFTHRCREAVLISFDALVHLIWLCFEMSAPAKPLSA